jgi:benzoate-CoA ligase family protein
MNGTAGRSPHTFNAAAYFLEANLTPDRRDRVAFYYQRETYTYQQVYDSVQRTVRVLSDLGIEQENRIAILLPDSPEAVFTFWAAIWLGAIPVPINIACKIDEIQYILQDSRAKLLLTHQRWQEALDPIHSSYLRHVVLVDGDTPFKSLLLQQLADPLPHAATHRDEPAFWLYTSGSTGRPKGVMHRHQSMVICAEQYGKATLGLTETDIVYSIANMAFAYGLGNTVYMPMAVGAAAVLSEANSAFDIINDIHQYRPTVLFGIPSVYANILAIYDISPLDVSSLRLCVSAAEQLPKSIWYQWRETCDREIYEGIGTTEFLHIFLANTPQGCKPGSSGCPVAGYNVQVVDEQGMPKQPGEIGDLQVSGESLMLGYWNRLQETRQALWGNTMRTGDKYVCDVDGYFTFMGRKDDLFKINGQWVSPLEIEDILHQHPDILEVAVLPEFSEDKQLTQVVAYVALKEELSASTELKNNIRQFAKQRLPHFKAPQVIHVVTHLPRTSTGKIHRKALSSCQ